MTAIEFVALGAQGYNGNVDTAIVLTDANGVVYKLKANSGTSQFEISKNGVTVNTPGATNVSVKAASYTVVPADTGSTFTTTGGSATITFTLPAIANVWNGWEATFINTVDQTMAITAPSGKLCVDGNAAATTSTFSTSSHKIGSAMKILYDGTLAKYIGINIGGTTDTIS